MKAPILVCLPVKVDKILLSRGTINKSHGQVKQFTTVSTYSSNVPKFTEAGLEITEVEKAFRWLVCIFT